jgi:hypothetical protein
MRESRRSRGQRRPEVEPLESFTLLSGLATSTALATPMIPISVKVIPLPVIVSLNGTTHGTWSVLKTPPDTGITYSVTTKGSFVKYGAGTVNGTFHTPGFILNGKATGSLLVTFPKGTLTLKLSAPAPKGFPALPSELSFVVTKGTGVFHNKVGDPVGRGTVKVTLFPAPPSASATPVNGNRVTLEFHSGIVVIL